MERAIAVLWQPMRHWPACLGIFFIALFSGCVMAAVHSVRLVQRELSPPQPVLRGTAAFFDGSIQVVVVLRPAARRRSKFFGEDAGDDDESDSATPPPPKNRMALWASFTNVGKETAVATVLRVDSILGKAVPAPQVIALAPGQKVVLDPLRSPHADNLKKLDVALSLQRGAAVEVQTVALRPLPDDS